MTNDLLFALSFTLLYDNGRMNDNEAKRTTVFKCSFCMHVCTKNKLKYQNMPCDT